MESFVLSPGRAGTTASRDTIGVRPATAADLPAIVLIANVAIKTGHDHFAVRPWELEEAEAEFAGRDPRHAWLVAEQRGEVVGYCRTGPWKPRGAYRWTVEVGVYVEAGSRGGGIGRALYGALIPALEEAGIRTVVAGIALPNWPSVALHEALGFKEAGLLPRVGFKAGSWRDVGYWVLHLGGDDPPE